MKHPGEIDGMKMIEDNNAAVGCMPPIAHHLQESLTKGEIPMDAELIIERLVLEERERCAALCDKLGDAEFAARAKKQNMGIATLAQRHYMACAKAIRGQ